MYTQVIVLLVLSYNVRREQNKTLTDILTYIVSCSISEHACSKQPKDIYVVKTSTRCAVHIDFPHLGFSRMRQHKSCTCKSRITASTSRCTGVTTQEATCWHNCLSRTPTKTNERKKWQKQFLLWRLAEASVRLTHKAVVLKVTARDAILPMDSNKSGILSGKIVGHWNQWSMSRIWRTDEKEKESL